MMEPESADVLAMDVAPPKSWRRFVPAWLRSLLWVDSAKGYDAFLSYSWTADMQIAPVIQSVIHRFLCPWYKVRAKTVFRDLSCLPAGSSLNHELFSRLDKSTHLIVLACPEAANSRGMDMEAKYWFSRHRTGEVLIIVTAGPLQELRDGVENGDRLKETRQQPHEWYEIRDRLLPPALKAHFAETEPVWVSLDHRRQDILSDPRSERLRGQAIEDLKQLFLRLYAGTTWEELQGEERAQKRRAMGLMAGVTALFLVAALAIVWQWSKAITARDEAQHNYESAVKVATETGRVVKDQVLPDGAQESKSVLAEHLLEASSNTFESLVAKYEYPSAALSRVQLLELLWNDYYILRDFSNASKAAKAEFDVAQQHESAWQDKKGDPSHADWLRYMVRANENLGDDARQEARGAVDLARAEGYFRDALWFAERLSADPQGVAWKNELPHAQERLGDILNNEGKFSEALVEYRSFLDSSSASGDIAWQRNLAVVHGKKGDMLVEQRDFKGAESEFQTDLEISEKLAKQVPTMLDLQRGVGVAHERLGFVRRKQGKLSDAAHDYRQELEVVGTLVNKDKADFQWQRDLALANEGLGDTLCDLHDYKEALKHYSAYLDIVSKPPGDSAHNARALRDIAIGHQRLGVALLGLGLGESARSEFQECLSISSGASTAFDARNPEPRNVRQYCAQIAEPPAHSQLGSAN
jgi:tetratricopeptide (TPR) repeat protein